MKCGGVVLLSLLSCVYRGEVCDCCHSAAAPQRAPLAVLSYSGWVLNVRGSSFCSQGNQIKSSCSLVAFVSDQAGKGAVPANLAVPAPLAYRHACSTLVKVWRICEPGQEQPASAEVSLMPRDGKLEQVLFHPAAAGLLAVASSRGLHLWDTGRDTALAGFVLICPAPDCFQGRFPGFGVAEDKNLRIFDPRAQLSAVQCRWKPALWHTFVLAAQTINDRPVSCSAVSLGPAKRWAE
ncbi:hypothetical protein P4O66_000668 [Electrophorus voltai]|uniref:Uncharacterized protein n=1 Tax=Electrophorus voltai TaxID=2609070 RepID=A0AAD8ZGQ9_9TELE|nr:hypothetical protein P4O66_000668 [Electrophorus voltai]